MPITYFCQKCWREVPADARGPCPHCGAILEDNASYVEKLIRALDAPEAMTALRAAYLLGKLKAAAAVPALAAKLQESPDPYLAAAACEALARIGTPEAKAAVCAARQHRFAPVREVAVRYCHEPSPGEEKDV
ncbi:MAG: HEAT repeat domain-containing protein [Bacillota bacterium]